MSLTRFLPIPSDRMGILWSLLHIEDCVILEYGPAGTTHFSMGLFGSLGIEQENRLFTTHMREEDVVMGDTIRLERALVEIDENFHPKVIFVVASSCSAVIGTDLKGVCTMIAQKVKARLIAFERGGFRGDYSAGLKEVYCLIADQLVENKAEKDELSFNVLGSSAGSFRAEADALEIERLMEKAFSMHVHARLCMKTDLEHIASMGIAGVNLVVRREAVSAAEILERKCQTPYVVGMPYGYEGTITWLEKVGKAVARDPDPSFIADLKKKDMAARRYGMYVRTLRRDIPKAILYGDLECVAGLGDFLEETGIKPVRKISTHSLAVVDEPRGDIEYYPVEADRIAVFKSAEHTLIMADDTAKIISNDSNTFVRISTPLINGSQIASHLPLSGPRGADMILESVSEYYNTLR